MRSNQLNYVPESEKSEEQQRLLFCRAYSPCRSNQPCLFAEGMVGGIRFERMTFCL